MKHRILSALLFILWPAFCGNVLAESNVPSWLAGKPDILEYPHHAELYEFVISDAERTLQVVLDGNDYAKKRLINAVNKAVEHWTVHKDPVYAANLRYLIIDRKAPLHYQFRLSSEEIDEYLID